MKKTVLPAVALFATMLAAQAQVFWPTNLVVMALGTNTQVLASEGNLISLYQYTTEGQLISATSIPTNGASAMLLAGTAPKEGYLTLAENGSYLVWGGYNTNYGWSASAAVFTASGSTLWRGIGTLDGYNNYTLQFAGNIFSAAHISGAAADGNGNFWANGSSTGTIYVTSAGSPVTVSTSGATGGIGLGIFGGDLYYSSQASGTPGIGLWELPGIPTTAGGNNASTTIIGKAASTPGDFYMNTTVGVAYLADYDAATSGGGITRFNYNATSQTWVSNYTLVTGTAGAYAVVADFSHTDPIVYATVGNATPATANTLVTFTDTGASSSPSVIATAPAGTTFRGLSWAPGAAPLISGPQSVTNDYGESVTFTLSIQATPEYYISWYSNSPSAPTFVEISGETDRTLTISNLTAAENGSIFYAVVSNSYGITTSAEATLTTQPLGAPINVTVTPSTQTVNAEGTATLTASFAGSTTGLSYGWRQNGVALHNGTLGASSVSGATTATLTISNAFAVNDGSYTVFVTNNFSPPYGTNSIPAILEVQDPGITTNIMGTTNAPNGANFTLTVGAVGTGLSYQWYSNGMLIIGATNFDYTVTNAAVSNESSYSVVVKNSSGQSVTNGPTIVDFTPILLYDTFNYANGDLFGDPGSPWKEINGSNPEVVNNDRVQISANDQTTDGQSLFAYPVTGGNEGAVLWASFVLNLQTLPPTDQGGTYFCNFEDTNFGFYGRIFALTSNFTGAQGSGFNFWPDATPTIPDLNSLCFPGTYRLGVAGFQTDESLDENKTGPSAVIPLDMSPGINYEVVMFYDPSIPCAGVAVNPASYNDMDDSTQPLPLTGVYSGISDDSLTPSVYNMAAFGLRQRQNEGVMYMSNLLVSWDWDGAGSGYQIVTSPYTAAKPVIGLQPVGVTNYQGNTYTMEVAASGIGFAGEGLTYNWYQNGAKMSDTTNISGSSTPVLTLGYLVGTNNGSYDVVVTGSAGATTSAVTVVSVNATLTPPSFTLPGAVEPISETNFPGQDVSFTATAEGTGPMSYQWYFNNGSYTQPVGSGQTLIMYELTTNQTGTYYVVATGGTGLTGQSANAYLLVTNPIVNTIGYLRSFMDPSSYQLINGYSGSNFTILGVITTTTNLTTGDTASYYIQDATGGINLFVTDGGDFRPQLGDLVTATGQLSVYENNLEMDVTEGVPGFNDEIVGSNSPLPAPIVLTMEEVQPTLATNITESVEGSLIQLNDVWFESYTPGSVFVSGDYYIVTNSAGLKAYLEVSDQDTNIVAGQLIPQFASSVEGVLYNVNADIDIALTDYAMIVPGTPPVQSGPITNLMGALSATNRFVLKWNATPSSSYSVWSSTNVVGPYSDQVATGLTFTNAAGIYSLTPTNRTDFYIISSP